MDETTKDTIWWTSDEYKNDNKPVTKGGLERAEEDRFAGAVGQEALRRRYFLRRQRELASEDPLHHGGRLAGALR